MELLQDYPQFTYEAGSQHMWLPLERTVIYNPDGLDTTTGRLGLLHEICHGILGHRYYKFDIELLLMEQDAWDLVCELAPKHALTPQEQHIDSCLDSYDSWLEQRATCPVCSSFGLQLSRNRFSCIHCGEHWQTNDRKSARVQRRRLRLG